MANPIQNHLVSLQQELVPTTDVGNLNGRTFSIQLFNQKITSNANCIINLSALTLGSLSIVYGVTTCNQEITFVGSCYVLHSALYFWFLH
ncbi:MAG: hypothetical protein JHC93_06165 [Parachlamydiales bacterium]|nr:hypothetical protein [Parachlamydiales bacterium]